MSLRIRSACLQDIDSLCAIRLQASLAWGEHVEEIRRLLESEPISVEHLPFTVVAEQAGEVVGFATVLHAPSRAELTELFVVPRWWRAGIGRQLLAAAEQRAAAQGAEALYVVANERARRFYEAAGYEVLGAVLTDFGEAPEMHRWL